MGWRRQADEVLAQLFVLGEPSAQALRDAYPFGERKYWPYKIWCKRVRAWKAAVRAGRERPLDMQPTYTSHDPMQLEAL